MVNTGGFYARHRFQMIDSSLAALISNPWDCSGKLGLFYSGAASEWRFVLLLFGCKGVARALSGFQLFQLGFVRRVRLFRVLAIEGNREEKEFGAYRFWSYPLNPKP